jgi:hypothetical protein
MAQCGASCVDNEGFYQCRHGVVPGKVRAVMGKKANIFAAVDAATEAAKLAERTAAAARRSKRREKVLKVLRIIVDILTVGASIAARFAMAKMKKRGGGEPPVGVA